MRIRIRALAIAMLAAVGLTLVGGGIANAAAGHGNASQGVTAQPNPNDLLGSIPIIGPIIAPPPGP